LSILKIFIYLYAISFFIACGDNKSTTSDIKLKTDYLSKDHNQTLPKEEIEIDLNQQIGKIRKELKNYYEIKYYLSNDKQDAFVVASAGYKIVLYHYSLFQVDPVLVNIIKDDLNLKKTKYIYFYPLKNGKMICIMNYIANIQIYVYDINSLENIGYLELVDDTYSYELVSKLHKGEDVVVFDLEEQFFIIDNDIRIEISDLYNTEQSIQHIQFK